MIITGVTLGFIGVGETLGFIGVGVMMGRIGVGEILGRSGVGDGLLGVGDCGFWAQFADASRCEP